MRKIFEWIGGFSLIAFSFYFTDQVSLLVARKSDLMAEIVNVSANYKEEAIDAVINPVDNTIVPGKFGKEVNDKDSYLSMHEFGAFNENYLIYNKIKPNISLEDNKDKYIKQGNESKRQVSFIIDHNTEIEEYFKKENIKYTSIAYLDDKLSLDNIEYINGESTKDNFKILNSKIKNNRKICLKDFSDLNSCKKYDYYIISPGIELNGTNIAEIKSQISSGSITLISANAKIEHVRLILNEINYKDLEIVYVSDLISEN